MFLYAIFLFFFFYFTCKKHAFFMTTSLSFNIKHALFCVYLHHKNIKFESVKRTCIMFQREIESFLALTEEKKTEVFSVGFFCYFAEAFLCGSNPFSWKKPQKKKFWAIFLLRYSRGQIKPGKEKKKNLTLLIKNQSTKSSIATKNNSNLASVCKVFTNNRPPLSIKNAVSKPNGEKKDSSRVESSIK